MTTAANPPPEPLLDLQRLGVAMRRSRRFWLSAGLLGLLAGIAMAILMPSPPTAVTRLLVVHEDEQGAAAGSLIKTDITLLETTRIAGAALQRINSADRPEDFLRDYKATALTNNVLEIKVKGADNDDAVARAQALADAFIADHVQRAQAAAQADAKSLIDRRTRAEAELAQVDASINGMSAADRRNRAAELEALFTRRGDLTSQIADLTSRAEDAGAGAPRVAAGTLIVDAPRAIPRRMLGTAVQYGAIGFGLALVAGLSLAAIRSVVRDRPVLRREIAEHLGASVIAQLRERPRWLPARPAKQRQRVATTLARTVREGGSVSLLELGTKRTTASLALDIATALSEEGDSTGGVSTSTVVVLDDLTRGRLARRLHATGGSVRVVDGDELAADRPQSLGRPEHLIGLGSVSPGTAWTDLPGLGAETLLVVRAGHANTLWLHTVARQLADLQIPIIGVVLVNPDRKDRSDGTLWDGLHTASAYLSATLRGRAGTVSAAPAEPAATIRPATEPTPAAAIAASTGQAAEPTAPAPDVTTGPAEAKTPAVPNRRTNGVSVASHADDYPTEVLGPIRPSGDDVEGVTNPPLHRPRRWQRFVG